MEERRGGTFVRIATVLLAVGHHVLPAVAVRVDITAAGILAEPPAVREGSVRAVRWCIKRGGRPNGVQQQAVISDLGLPIQFSSFSNARGLLVITSDSGEESLGTKFFH